MSFDTSPWSHDTPFTSCERLQASTDIENFSLGSLGLVLPRLIYCSQVMPSTSG